MRERIDLVKGVLEAIFRDSPSVLPYYPMILMLGLYCISAIILDLRGQSDDDQEDLKWAIKVSITSLIAILGIVAVCLSYRMALNESEKVGPLTIRETVYQPNMTI